MQSGSHRRQWIALILSGIFPGLGQFYLRAWWKGLAFFLASLAITWALGEVMSVEDLVAGNPAHPFATLALLLALLAAFLWSVIDAWRLGGHLPSR